jgi:hypothetical protein
MKTLQRALSKNETLQNLIKKTGINNLID